ncbi:PepSY domain-containing protein [Salegentibacter chungangensis]|uniref:PepSY domain-containing protein n=1 Tax=Salegentibacter chungangensis TaxID=1335724 RepID=A0ABW3NRZ4_9FLAO
MAVVKRKTAKKIRQTHRYLGIFIGIQFLMWTISGLYFSWTDIDEIHGDHLRKTEIKSPVFQDLKSPDQLRPGLEIESLQLKEIAGKPYYWVNSNLLINAKTGAVKEEISKDDALKIAGRIMREDLNVKGIEKINNTGKHHEYRSGPLPAYVISYDNSQNIKAYVAAKNGEFQTLRHRDWRWFDFLWMTHTMDYEGRDDFNNLLLRAFSLLGLITVFSGFLLWFISSPRIIKLHKRLKK